MISICPVCNDVVRGEKHINVLFPYLSCKECVYSGFTSWLRQFLHLSLNRIEEAEKGRGVLDGSHSQASWQEVPITHRTLITSSRSHRGDTVHVDTLKRYEY